MITITEYTLPSTDKYRARDGLLITTPYCPAALPTWREIPGRLWLRDEKANFVPLSSRREVWELLKLHHAGEDATGPKGAFVVAPSAPVIDGERFEPEPTPVELEPVADDDGGVNWGEFQFTWGDGR